ncbi:hypothetical protein CMO91_04265 [Candidatus Woesearchaeota archaeon]|nr:hypothetical protein [Candidatus Woesearchaeota archaeon]
MEKGITRLVSLGKRLTGVDVAYFAKGGFWMGMLQAWIMLTGTLLSILFARMLPKVEFGQYQLIVSVFATMSIAALPGLNSAIMQEVVKGHDKSVLRAISYRIKTSLIGSLGLLCVAGFFWYTRKDVLFSSVFLLASLVFPFTTMISALASFFNAKQKFSSSFWYQSIDRTILFGCLIGALFLRIPVVWIGGTYIVATAASNILLYFIFRYKNPVKGGEGEVIRKGKQLTLVLWGVKLLMHADRLLLGYILGMTKLAVYTISLLIPDAMDTMLNTLNSVAFAKLSKTDKKTLWGKIGRPWLVIVGFAGVAIVYQLLPWLVPLVFGQQYLDSVRPAQVYVLIIPALFLFRLCCSWLLAQGRNKRYALYLNGYHAAAIIALVATALLTRSVTAVIASRVITMYAFAFFTIFRLRVT